MRHKREAIAMIELIFAIVIMGIAMMSAPMLVSTAKKSVTVGLQQAAINEAASRIQLALSMEWDENEKNCTLSCGYTPILHVNSGNPQLNEYNQSGRRQGTPKESDARTFICPANGLEFNASSLAVDGKDDIDDFAEPSSLVTVSGTGGGTDYIEKNTVTITTSVSYIKDIENSSSFNQKNITYVPIGTPGGTSNIKKISVTLSSSNSAQELQKNITLSAFACNIGDSLYLEHRILQ